MPRWHERPCERSLQARVGGRHVRGHRARGSHRSRDLADRRRRQGTAGAAARQLPLVHTVRLHADSVADGDAERHGHHVVHDIEPDAVSDRVQSRAPELPDAAAAAAVDAPAHCATDDDHGLDHNLEHVEHDIDLVVEDEREPDASSLIRR